MRTLLQTEDSGLGVVCVVILRENREYRVTVHGSAVVLVGRGAGRPVRFSRVRGEARARYEKYDPIHRSFRSFAAHVNTE